MNPREIGLIDSRNEKLWNDLNKTHSISICLTHSIYYACDSEENYSEISVPKNNIDIESFTHELLHVYIRQMGLYFGARLKLLVNGNNKLSKILSKPLIEHFGNCIDHIKMLPIYLDLGFDRKRFIADYDENKCTNIELQQLKNSFKIRDSYKGKAVDFYIGKYISIKADPKQHINYPKALAELKALDSSLFEILETCTENWEKMPLKKENIFDDDYITISYEFYQNLSDWAEEKVFL